MVLAPDTIRFRLRLILVPAGSEAFSL